MTSRPSGFESGLTIDALMAQHQGIKRRRLVTSKIRGQTLIDAEHAERPSIHLRWGLQKMKLRGWRNDDWGQLFDEYGNEGQGPICLLEAVHAPMDSPGQLIWESPEQYYLRLAFVALDWDPPLYLSEWNDAQKDFDPIEQLMLTAIALAETDEAVGAAPYDEAEANSVRHERFGITKEKLEAARTTQKAEDAKG